MPKVNTIKKIKNKNCSVHVISVDYGTPHVHVFIHSKKKRRGWRAKTVYNVQVSEITEDRFRVQTYVREYYVSRLLFPHFLNASESQLRNVVLLSQHSHDENGGHYDPNDEHWDLLYWKDLNVDIGTLALSYPQLKSFEWKIQELNDPELLKRYELEIGIHNWQRYSVGFWDCETVVPFFAENDEEAKAIAHFHHDRFQPKEGGYVFQVFQEERLVYEHGKPATTLFNNKGART